MSKAVLVLEDGRVFDARIKGLDINQIGSVTLRSNNASLTHPDGQTEFTLESNIKDFTNVKGKLVIDELPVDYHLYDLKTAM